MWIRFIKDSPTNQQGDIVWLEDNKNAVPIVNNGEAIRVLGPDGKLFEDSAPEDIITQMAAEDNISFKQKEKEMSQTITKLQKEKKSDVLRQISLGQKIDNAESII
jgi:hypothetical protein